MTQTDAVKLYLQMQELYKLERKREALAMQLFCHPKATANQVMELQGKLVQARASYHVMLARVIPRISRPLPYRYNLDSIKL